MVITGQQVERERFPLQHATAAILFNNKNEVLLVRYKNPLPGSSGKIPDMYALPSIIRKPWQSPEINGVDSLKEEAGIEIMPEKLSQFPGNSLSPALIGRTNGTVLRILMTGYLYTGSEDLLPKDTATTVAKWASLDELDSLEEQHKLNPNVRAIVMNAVSYRSRLSSDDSRDEISVLSRRPDGRRIIEARFNALYGDPAVISSYSGLHPLGFQRIEYTLPDSLLRRHDFVPVVGRTEPHQHGDDFVSEVDSKHSKGRIIEQLFEFQVDPDGPYELWPVVCYARDGKYRVDAKTDQVVRVKPIVVAEFEHVPGDSYRRPWGDYHYERVVDGPVTTYSEWGKNATTGPHFFMRNRSHPESLYQEALRAGRPTTDLYVAEPPLLV